MLTKTEYEELINFRNGPVHRMDGPTLMIDYLVSCKYIKAIETDVADDLCLVTTKWAIEPLGLIALDSYEEDLASKAKSEATARKRFILTIAVSAIAALAAIASALTSLQSLRPVPAPQQYQQDEVSYSRYYLEYQC